MIPDEDRCLQGMGPEQVGPVRGDDLPSRWPGFSGSRGAHRRGKGDKHRQADQQLPAVVLGMIRQFLGLVDSEIRSRIEASRC